MPLNPITDVIVSEMRAAVASRPAGELERALVSRVITAALTQLPLPADVLGEALIQFTSMLRWLLEEIRETDRELGGCIDWESTAVLAGNITMFAGVQLYTGAEA